MNQRTWLLKAMVMARLLQLGVPRILATVLLGTQLLNPLHSRSQFFSFSCYGSQDSSREVSGFLITFFDMRILRKYVTDVELYVPQPIQQGKIGLVTDFVWYEPLTRSKAAENYAAQRAGDFHLGW